MITLTDYALFTTLGRSLGSLWYDTTNPLSCVRGVWADEDSAFRDYEKRDGKLRFPLYALKWTGDITRDETRWNLPQARHGRHLSDTVNKLEGFKVKLYPVNVDYELNIWCTKTIRLIDSIKEILFFSSDVGGNGAVVDFEDLDERIKQGTDKEILESLQGFTFDLTIDPSVSVTSSSSSEDGKYHTATVRITAHTWLARGFKVPLVRKIMSRFYTEESDGSAVLARTFDFKPDPE